jgi:SRSO17 transposase
MTEQDIADLGPAFAAYLRRFRGCFCQDRAAAHFDTYCRGLLADLPRKSVEPIALAAGTAVRTLQEFLVTARWNHDRARDTLQRHLAGLVG